jgi:hypothetical protein
LGRWASGVIVGGVLLLAGLAVADALRGNGGGTASPRTRATPSRTTTTTEVPPLTATLRREEIGGFVRYSDNACRLHTLALPSMDEFVVRRPGTNEPVRRCTFGITGGRLLPENAFLSPDRTQVARCRRAHVEVRDASGGALRSRVRGCAPAWRPDGALTYARAGGVLVGGRVLLSRRELHAAARRHPNVGGLGRGIAYTVHVIDLAWLDTERLLVSLETRLPYGPEPLAVLFHEKEIIGSASRFGQRLGHWIVSRAGSFAAAADGTIMARDGDSMDPPQNLPDGRAVAFTPDERWLVYVTGVSVYLIGTPRNSEPARIIRLPVPARDLDWEEISPATPAFPRAIR